MISNDIKIIQSDFLLRETKCAIRLTKLRSILNEYSILRAGYEEHRRFVFKGPSKKWLLLFIVIEGQIRMRVGSNDLAVSAGEMLIVPPGIERFGETTTTSLKMMYLHLDVCPKFDYLNQNSLYKITAKNSDALQTIFLLFNSNSYEFFPEATEAFKSLTRAICEYVMEDLSHMRQNSRYELKKRLQKVWQTVEENPNNEWSLGQIATAVSLSKRQLLRICRKFHNTTPMNMVTRIRLEKGRSKLQSSDEKLENIAFSVGFSSARAFSHAFLKEYGIRPGKYRTEQII